MNRLTLGFFCGIALLFSAPATPADIFVLNNDGQVQGEVVNVDESPRQHFVIRTSTGGQITLDKNQIKQIIPQSPAELEYERTRPTYPDTADGQWKLAEWCREHSLSKQRQTHLERVVQLDPDNKSARAALGYTHADGRWVRQNEIMEQRGYVRYKGQWMLPQAVELAERRSKEALAEKEWYGKLKRWRNGVDVGSDRANQSHDDLLAIKDTAATPALIQLMNNDTVEKVKIWCIEELLQLGTSNGVAAVVDRTLNDADEEVRLSAIDRLIQGKHPEVVPMYILALKKSHDSLRINRAAYALGRLKDKSAIGALIDVLVTTQTFKEVTGNPGQTSSTFSNGPGGSGGGGLAVGGSVNIVKHTSQNQLVLDALMRLTDGSANFGYDARAWRSWYATQKKSGTIDARRD